MSVEKINELESALIGELSKQDVKLNTRREDSNYNGTPLVSDEGYSAVLRKLFNDYTLYLVSLIEGSGLQEYLLLLRAKQSKAKAVKEEIEFFRRENDGDLREEEGEFELIQRAYDKEGFKHFDSLTIKKLLVEARKSVLQMIGFQQEYISKLIEFYEQQLIGELKFGDRNTPVVIGEIIYDPQQYDTRISWLRDYSTFMNLISLLQKYEYIDNLTTLGYSQLLSLMNFVEYDISKDLTNDIGETLQFSTNMGKIKWLKSNMNFAELYWVLIEEELIESHGEKDLKDFTRNFMSIFEFTKTRKNTKKPLESLAKTIITFYKVEKLRSNKSKRTIGKHIKTFFPKN